MVKLLEFVQPIARFLPTVQPPPGSYPGRPGNVPFMEKIKWTVGTLFVFLVCSHMPLYGIRPSTGADPLRFVRAMLASNQGTLMELGISPIVNSGLMMQLMQGMKILEVGQDDIGLFKAAQKLGGILITVSMAIIYVLSGMYGPVSDLGWGNATLIIFQLFVAGIFVLLIDELLEKHGMGSGISLFIATNICQSIVWAAFSPMSHKDPSGNTQYEGAIIALFHLLITRTDKIPALKEAFYRTHQYNLTNLLATAVVIMTVAYFEGFHVTIPIQLKRNKQQRLDPFQVKLFYTSNMPIILQSTVVANIYQVSQIIYNRFGHNNLIRMLGEWASTGGVYNRMIPTGGLVYYISPVQSFSDIIRDPLHCVVYVSFMLISCSYFSSIWVEVSGESAKDILKRWTQGGPENHVIIQGYHNKEAMLGRLNDKIRPASLFGGMCIGALTVFADFMGVIGSGTGILLAVSNICSYARTYQIEKKRMQMGKARRRR